MHVVDGDQIASTNALSAGEVDSSYATKGISSKDATVEVSEHGQAYGAPKTYYSKLSIWLMILYSGLAIGSDG